ncbi:MAG: DAK2 domain-containing protein, partial [Christensenellaceae bacterium]
MNIAKIDGGLLKEMIHNGLMLLERNKKAVDALNVFPVPDGDTGTNMSLTLRSAAKEVEKTQSESAGEVAEAMSRGALKGARGNSGVILSQLFRGFYKGVQGKAELSPADMAAAFRGGVEMAYKAVMKPREGTVLTVSRGFADAAVASAERQGAEADMILMMEEALAAGQATLERTPEMLDVLKQAGVVDAGGKGLLIIYEGWLGALRGEEIEGEAEEGAPAAQPEQDQAAGEEALSAAAGSLQEITFG